MAEFRKLFYAFGLAALLTGVSGSANAQTSTICNSNAGVPPVIRSESFADLVGDYVLDCTGGTPTPSGQAVPQVNFTVTLSTQITSRLLTSSGFSEALLLVDEPNRTTSNPVLACGDAGALDNTSSGAGVCPIIAGPDSTTTYNGTEGHPNVFQGRTGVAQNLNDSNIIVFAGVPFDPPGTNIQLGTVNHRYLRFTNIRANAPLVSSSFLLQTVVMNVNVNGSTAVAINNPSQVVASVQRGLQAPTVTSVLATYVQCVARNQGGQKIRFREGFESSFKTKGLEQIIENGDNESGTWRYDGLSSTPYGSPIRQNIPGATFNTESGFTALNTQASPSANDLTGFTSLSAPGTGFFSSSAHNGIGTAGIATQGTRLAVSFRDIPAGVTVTVPLSVNLYPQGTSSVPTGVAILVNTTSNGANATTGIDIATSGVVGASNQVVYEIVSDDPFTIEDMTVDINIQYAVNLASNLPDTTKTAQVAGGFAPYYDPSVAVQTASSTLPVPRFRNLFSPFADLFRVSKCSCNLLFPFVTNASAPNGNYDTGIAIANTSATPGSTFGFTKGQAQEGAVQFWYYPALSSSAAVATQCTNTASPGTCPGTKAVKAGETLTYILSQGSSTWGLDARGAGFTGYVIAQTQFQYCHAFAYISPQGALPSTPGMSVGYLGLVLDNNELGSRTVAAGEQLNN